MTDVLSDPRLPVFCSKICGGKCCVLHLPDEGSIPCPNLTEEKSCGVYKERYREGAPDIVVVGYWKSRRYTTLSGEPATRPFFCGRMHQLHAAGAIPQDVADGCALIHPELLEKV